MKKINFNIIIIYIFFNYSCSKSPTSAQSPIFASGSIFCSIGPTTIVDVTNPKTGKTWMDRNLGASQVATSKNDTKSYGDLYQWGRRSDGHQCRNSSTTSALSNTLQPSHGFFITTNGGTDWTAIQNDNAWQSATFINNPCPLGYRLPTDAEFEEERLSWSSQFNSPLKLPMSGIRGTGGGIGGEGNMGTYWTMTVSASLGRSRAITISDGTIYMHNENKSSGLSVRCIKN